MSTDHQHHHDHQREHLARVAEAARPPEERPERPESGGTPEHVQQAAVSRKAGATEPAGGKRARGVEWVRPTDLIARQTSTVAGRGIDFQAELSRRARTPLVAGMRRAAERARRLPPVSAFGRGNAGQRGPTRSAVGMR